MIIEAFLDRFAISPIKPSLREQRTSQKFAATRS
jgi:hypothetical protein